MMLGRQRASVEEGRVEEGRVEGGLREGTSEEGTGRGMGSWREEASLRRNLLRRNHQDKTRRD